ncbi:AGE family epimerase/isomerase [Opitutus sp. ER46]|uniref:AGE family epimerase/isomerase n=1 Tax=Opitutus sp. ER46 TaxID=2161864 RepID=UPI000D30F04F|nr:AGE family epimerase/isomerase [Opitutus sp. ER46]PTY00376.1 hypothetical protein DB354_01840 [Opitutus sp. ER46]
MSTLSVSDTKRACSAALEQLRGGDGVPLAGWLRDHLFGHVLPFWEEHAFDERGGLLTCITDAGKVVSTDKWLWSQWRAVWVFARIYNRLDADVRWLGYAKQIAAFCLRYGRDEERDGWSLVVAQDGRKVRGFESTYVDSFAVYALAELHRATRDPEVRREACRTADTALRRLAQPYDTIPHFPYPIPPRAKPHGIPMLWSLALADLGHALKEEKYLNAAVRFSTEIFRDFYREDRDLFLEIIRSDGREFPAPLGTAVVPGHVIEDMWFQLHVGELARGGPGWERKPEILRLALRHLEAGWDAAYGGGLLLAFDANGGECRGWKFPDTKLWWPHTEALYMSLLGWKLEQRPAFLDWYERVWRLCLDHFADWAHGEWRQKLGRDLSPIEDVVALPVKDPFHLPRSLILQIELLERGFDPTR